MRDPGRLLDQGHFGDLSVQYLALCSRNFWRHARRSTPTPWRRDSRLWAGEVLEPEVLLYFIGCSCIFLGE